MVVFSSGEGGFTFVVVCCSGKIFAVGLAGVGREDWLGVCGDEERSESLELPSFSKVDSSLMVWILEPTTNRPDTNFPLNTRRWGGASRRHQQNFPLLFWIPPTLLPDTKRDPFGRHIRPKYCRHHRTSTNGLDMICIFACTWDPYDEPILQPTAAYNCFFFADLDHQ